MPTNSTRAHKNVIDLERATRADEHAARVAIIDDHQAFAEALAMAMAFEPGFEVVGVATTPWQAREVLGKGADVALIDVGFQGQDGLALARDLAGSFPRVRLVILSDIPDPAMLEEALLLGAAGFIPKSLSLSQLVESIRGVCADQSAVPTSLLAEIMDGFRRREARQREARATRSLLTDREYEILNLIAQGLSTKLIASRLSLSVNTVRSHAQNTLTKLGAHSRLEAVAYARATGLICTADDR